MLALLRKKKRNLRHPVHFRNPVPNRVRHQNWRLNSTRGSFATVRVCIRALDVCVFACVCVCTCVRVCMCGASVNVC